MLLLPLTSAFARNVIEPHHDGLHGGVDDFEHGEHGEAEQEAERAADVAQERHRPVIGALFDLIERKVLIENAEPAAALVARLHRHRFRVRHVNVLLALAPAVRAVVRRPLAVKQQPLDDHGVRPVGIGRRAVLQFGHCNKIEKRYFCTAITLIAALYLALNS